MNSGVKEELEVVARVIRHGNLSIDAARHVVNRFYQLLEEKEANEKSLKEKRKKV